MEDVVHGPDREVGLEMVVENIEDAAQGSVARQRQRDNESSDPVLRDRKVEQRDVGAE
jgi:hypothetical protein